MPTEVLFYFFQHKDARVKLEFQLVFQCAPFLKGLRASCGIMVEKSLYHGLDSIFQETGITYKKLLEVEDKYLVLLYRRKELGEALGLIGIRSFLRDFGYDERELDKMLRRLSMRTELYTQGKKGFPHEIGVFLGYPIEDVKGFIKNEGKGHLMTGYWKVYSDPVRAKRLFRQYDDAKNYAVNKFLTGMSIYEIVQNRW